jgi:hypothetical protein
MLITPSQAQTGFVEDRDRAFYKVNNRLPAHQLPEGVVASAVNQRFDEGKPRPRYGVGFEKWGDTVNVNLISGMGFWASSLKDPTLHARVKAVNGFTVGTEYLLMILDAGTTLSTAYVASSTTIWAASGTTIAPGRFTATQTTYYLVSVVYTATFPSLTIRSRVFPSRSPLAYGRFNDPNGNDNGVLITDEARSDGGVGRAWRIVPGNVPQEIPLNGHDVWETSQVLQCFNGLLLLRPGDERHYFAAAAVDTSADTILLNCLPAWNDGDLVEYVPLSNSQILGTSAPNPNAAYYVKTDAATNKVTLHPTRADALAGTNKLNYGSAVGTFYLKRTAQLPGFYGNGAPPLLMQPTDTLTAFENGFKSAPTAVAVTNSLATDTGSDANNITAPNHRLVAGDQVSVTLSTDGALTKFARPLSDFAVQLYDTADHALAGGATGLYDISADAQTGTLSKVGAAAMPMPPARIGVYYKQRVVLVNGKNNVLISDPLDPLHFQPFNSQLTANLGDSGIVTQVIPIAEDTLLFIKSDSVLALTGLGGAPGGWALIEVSREYGGLAARGTVANGADVWTFGRRGIESVAQTTQGVVQGVALPVSNDIQRRLQSVDWRYADQVCAGNWNNRTFFAVPNKGQSGTVTNNAVLVWNAVNQGWEDLWQGDLLTPVAFARLKVNGDERLTFCNAHGQVCWFTDGFADYDAAIETELLTRGYFAGEVVLCLKGEVNWDTFNPNLTVSALSAGVNEEQIIIDALTMDRTTYLVDGPAAYDPDTATPATFLAPHRADYSPAAVELFSATLDTHQNTTQPLRLRLRDCAIQLRIRNTQGSARINSVGLAAKPVTIKGLQT